MTDKDFELDLDFLDDEKPTQSKPEIKKEDSLDLDTETSEDTSISTKDEETFDIDSDSIENTAEKSSLDDEENFLWEPGGLEIPGIIVDDSETVSNPEIIPNFVDWNKKSISWIFSDKKNIMIAWVAWVVLIIIWVWVFFMMSAPKKVVVKSVPTPTVQTSVIEDQSSSSGSNETVPTNSWSEANSGTSAVNESTNSGTSQVTLNSWSLVSNTNSGNTTVNNTSSSTTPDTTVNNDVKKDSSDISIPLQTITEKVEVNADGSLKKTANTDLETRNVKEWSIILDNSQNKLPNLLDLTVSGIENNKTFKVTDEITVKLDWITNSLSIDPSIKWSVNKDSYIININLQFFKDSIISSEKWTLKYSESLPLDFMKPGIKKLFILVNWTIFKTINFNIQ